MKNKAVIAGSGPAGIMLGYLLARAGITVTVLEKWPDFFRDFRGDTIHPSTMTVLDELGLLEKFLTLPHNKTQRMLAHIGGEPFVVADFSKLKLKTPYIAFIPQWDFLNFMAEQAKQFPSFNLMMGTEVTDIVRENGRVVGVRAKQNDKEIEIRGDVTIGADGRHSIVREKAGLLVKDLKAPIDVLWFSVSQTPDNIDESLAYIDYGKMMVLLDRDTYWQCAFIIKKDSFASIKGRGLEAFKKDITKIVPNLASSVDELKDWDQVKFLSVSVDYLVTWYKEGLLCIGDSAHAMSPIGGVGINLAIQDAVAAANVLVPRLREGVPSTVDFAQIQKRRERATRSTQNLQVFLHKHLLEPILRTKDHMQLPWYLRFINKFSFLKRMPAKFLATGFLPEHIKIKF